MWSLAGGTLRDETAGTTERLERADRCTVQRDALAFEPDGSAVALAHGSFYVRAAGARAFAPTHLCTGVDGAPWAQHPGASGWALAAHRPRGHDLVLLRTDDPSGHQGWNAITALDQDTAAVIVDADESIGALTEGGHFVVIDRTHFVAGEVIETQGRTYGSLTRTASGLCAARDGDDGSREVLTGTSLTGRWTRRTSVRVPGSRTLRVFATDYGRLVAATDRGVEWADARGPFVELLRWDAAASPDAGADARSTPEVRAANPALGWFVDGSVGVVTRGAIAGRCEAVRAALPR